jgi:hypothetical protein
MLLLTLGQALRVKHPCICFPHNHHHVHTHTHNQFPQRVQPGCGPGRALGVVHSRTLIARLRVRGLACVGSGCALQAVAGGIGVPNVLSSMKRPSTVLLAQSTRDQELRRLVAPDPTLDRHGPLDYHVENALGLTRPRGPVIVIGKASRDAATQLPCSPGPTYVRELGGLCGLRASCVLACVWGGGLRERAVSWQVCIVGVAAWGSAVVVGELGGMSLCN